MSWVEQRGKQFRVYERTPEGRAFEPFATRDDADRFRQLVGVLGWQDAVAFVRGTPEDSPTTDPTTPRTPARVPAGAPAELRPAGITVGDLCRSYVAARRGHVEEHTLDQYASYIDLHIDPWFGDLDAGYVISAPHPAVGPEIKTISDWQAWLKAQPVQTRKGPHPTRTLSHKSRRNINGFASAAFNWALDADINPVVDRNPLRKGVGKAPDSEEKVFLEPAQFDALYRAMNPHHRPLLLFMVLTGLRWAEVAGLQVKRVHLDPALAAPYVEVVTALKHVKGGGVTLGRLKSRASWRVLTIPAVLVPVLRALTEGRDGEDFVFTMSQGGPLHHSNFVDRFLKPAIAKADGLVPEATRPHALRHTSAAWLLSNGATLYEVSRQLGHESAVTTDKHYGHLARATYDKNAEILSSIGARITSGTAPGGPKTARSSTSKGTGNANGMAQVIDIKVRLDAADRALPEVEVGDLDFDSA